MTKTKTNQELLNNIKTVFDPLSQGFLNFKDCFDKDKSCADCLLLQAKDAIEELIFERNDISRTYSVLLNDYIEERKKHAWIPVGERLPDYGVSVITFDEIDGVTEDVYLENILVSGDAWRDGNKVTHWMPKPLPPKEKQK